MKLLHYWIKIDLWIDIMQSFYLEGAYECIIVYMLVFDNEYLKYKSQAFNSLLINIFVELISIHCYETWSIFNCISDV